MADNLHSRRGGKLCLGSVCKACKSLLLRRHPAKKSSLSNVQPEDNKLKSVDKVIKNGNHDDKTMTDVQNIGNNGHGMHEDSLRGPFKHQNIESYFVSTPSPFSSPATFTRAASTNPSRSASPLSRSSSSRKGPTRNSPATLLKSLSRRSVDSASPSPSADALTRSASRRNSTIMYSNSNGLIKPPTMEKQLECTFEELCFGCIKKIKVTRDAVTNDGQIVQEDEMLTIKVKPGWRKGTKITFEGMGNETPGTQPADITFVIAEKQHPTFTREGDDLDFAIKLPLVKALTGCTVSIPLLGGEHMSLTMDDIICPGYQKIIAGQGMPLPKEQGEKRKFGNQIPS